MSDIAIHAEGLSKQYRIGAKQSYRTLRDSIAASVRLPLRVAKRAIGSKRTSGRHASFWALDNISFEIKQGEVVGIIGRNGAGKSTLLKVLSRITDPTRGYADIYGRVGSLLEVGTGFHPELTGRENIYLNGAILGMRRAEIESKLDEIIAFAEIDQFLDTAVKHYSSGMYLRLAFAVAAHLEPEILLVDEVLAVGDAAFQKKCIGKMSEVSRDGRTVVFVSHNMAAVRQLCTSALLLSAGAVATSGRVDDVIHQYLSTTYSDAAGDLGQITDRKGAGGIRLRSIRFEDQNGYPLPGLICGRPGRVILTTKSDEPRGKVQACVAFLDHFNQRLMYLNSYFGGADMALLPVNGELVCHIPRVHLAPGRYRLELWVKSDEVMQDRISDAGTVEVTEGNFYGTGRALAEGFQVALMDFSWTARENADRSQTPRPSHADSGPADGSPAEISGVFEPGIDRAEEFVHTGNKSL